jgi:hypothetical protein
MMAVILAALARRMAETMRRSSSRFSFTGVHVDWITYTSLPRTLSSTATDTSPSAKLEREMPPRGIPSSYAISSASCGLERPAKTDMLARRCFSRAPPSLSSWLLFDASSCSSNTVQSEQSPSIASRTSRRVFFSSSRAIGVFCEDSGSSSSRRRDEAPAKPDVMTDVAATAANVAARNAYVLNRRRRAAI